MTGTPCTIHGDWGGTHLRLFLLRGDTLLERATGPGIGALPATPAETLRAAIAPWRAAHPIAGILLCGMAGARNGLAEAPYLECPADLPAWSAAGITSALDGTPVTIAPGLACTQPDGAPDVMRGEETQLFGALALSPALAHGPQTVVLPGTHSKWARLHDGRVTGFRTWLTGELFTLLAAHSSLTRTGATEPAPAQDEPEGFAAGLARAATPLLGALFEARAAQLRHGRSLAWARGFLSGLLIGHEVQAQLAATPAAITLIGDPQLTARYRQALHPHPVHELDGQACVRAGLAAYQARPRPHPHQGAPA